MAGCIASGDFAELKAAPKRGGVFENSSYHAEESGLYLSRILAESSEFLLCHNGSLVRMSGILELQGTDMQAAVCMAVTGRSGIGSAERLPEFGVLQEQRCA